MMRLLYNKTTGKVLTVSGLAVAVNSTSDLEIATVSTLSQADYDALSEKVEDTLYLITGTTGYVKAYLGETPLYMMLKSGPAPREEITVTGVSPLSFTTLDAGIVISLIRYGKCEQASTPTPTVPVDIKCNNGALKWMDDELPLGYTRLQYIHFDGASYFDSGIVPNTYDYEIETKVAFDNSASSPLCAWGYMGSTSSLPRWLLAAYASGYLLNANTTAAMGIAFNTDAHVFKGVVYENNGTPYWASYIDGEQRQNVAMTGTAAWEANTLPVFIGGRNNNGTAGNYSTSDLYYHKVTKDGVVIQHLVACRNASNVIGMYDLVTGVFHANEGSGTITAGPVDNTHLVVKAVGTPEVITLGGKNLDGDVLQDKGYSSTGSVSTSTTFVGTLRKIKVMAGQKLTVSFGGFTTDGISGVFVNTWKTDGTWNMRQAISSQGVTTYTIPEGIGEVNFTLYKTGGTTIDPGAWMQVEYGSSATAYEPYREPQTASVENLFGVGDYNDEQDIISGSVTREVGIKVLNGTESVSTSGAGWAISIADKLRSKLTLFCTHYPYSSATMANAPDKSIVSFASQNIGIKDSSFTSASDVTTWLTTQYAAGTPVLVLYPLAEETTESATPQELETAKGNNVVSSNANVSSPAITITYQQ